MARAAVLFAAPHRLLFLTGAFQFAAIMAWWSGALLELLGVPAGLPHEFPASLLHAPLLLFLALPPFYFGFLLTVFPRWMGFPDSAPPTYLPVAVAFLLSAALLWLSLAGMVGFAIIGAFTAAATGWAWALFCMGRLAWLERRAGKPPTWHAWSILAAVSVGLACLVVAAAGLGSLDPLMVHVANLAALDLFILPVFLTVCHRMIPFFAGNVVADYTIWRPYWVLAAFWSASIAATAGFTLGISAIAAAAKLILAVLTGLMLWKWSPRGSAPGLLWVLILGFAWMPLGFGLAAWTELSAPEYGRASIHLLTVGFAASLMVAMVTRVTQGHSGRPLTMPALAWLAFAAIQIATLLRLLAAANGEQLALLAASAICLTVGVAPWALRAILIYLRPRADGKPG